MIVTRFAPSPTGRLHVGHAYSALFAYRMAQEAGGKFILRIEDIDPVRCHKEFEHGIYEDLGWLGLDWEKPVRRQSDHMDEYSTALTKLQNRGLLYPCFCTRKDIREEVERSGHAPHGPEGLLYPGLCKGLSDDERAAKIASGIPYAFRLDLDKALQEIKGPLTWVDRARGEQIATPEILGDAVLARKDIQTSYHLSVTIDDHVQGVTVVTRGDDLFYASHLHRLLQELLGLNVPEWHHHPFLTDEDGERLAKRNHAITIQHYREAEGKTPQDIMEMIGL
ncbi:MAG: tRNA glutamyl-Q(34) synthetase GluQRS [Rhodospirillales bacterium]|nr:tRNA glutamyl-Q(34) synthetase GluQRS [Rhodospirillales bacterium]